MMIETERLIIRSFRIDDADDLFSYLHKPSARFFLSPALSDRIAANAEAQKRSCSDDYLAIVLKSEDIVIGEVFAMPEIDSYVD
jgi:RimJ/RimL family protein N-acetyltransferase